MEKISPQPGTEESFHKGLPPNEKAGAPSQESVPDRCFKSPRDGSGRNRRPVRLGRFLLFTALTILVLLVAIPRILGALAVPILEKKLSSLFGMPVHIEAMDVNLLTRQVYAEGVEFRNQPGFSYSPHLWVHSLQFDIDFWALRQQHVKIGTVILREPYFLIEKAFLLDKKQSNIKTWIRHMKEIRRESAQENPGSSSWQVSIDNITIAKGVFVYDDRSLHDQENRFVFQALDGKLTGFKWPSVSPSHLGQKLEIGGLLGHSDPAAFRVTGGANFATSEVSFDLSGTARGGAMREYKRFWDTLPVYIDQGKYDLDIRMICVRKRVRSKSLLRLYDLKIVPGTKVTEIIWGIPVASALGFLQNQKEIFLKVPVSGNINDPKFAFDEAFIRAFQTALGQRLMTGVKIFTQGPVRFAEQTGRAVVLTQESFTSGLGKVTSIIAKKEEAK